MPMRWRSCVQRRTESCWCKRKQIAPAIAIPVVIERSVAAAAGRGKLYRMERGRRPAVHRCGEEDLIFANLVCKHLKSNAIALIKNRQLIGKGCGQTSRIDSVRQAIAKAAQFNFDLKGAVLASDAFFPFNDSVQIAHALGLRRLSSPGGRSAIRIRSIIA